MDIPQFLGLSDQKSNRKKPSEVAFYESFTID
jgi:hypothetical protein